MVAMKMLKLRALFVDDFHKIFQLQLNHGLFVVPVAASEQGHSVNDAVHHEKRSIGS